MNKVAYAVILLLTLAITGCGGDSSAREVPPYNYTPALYYYGLVDSYETDTEFSNAPLALNPYIFYGLFEVYWDANSLEDYRVRFSVNDRPSLTDSVLIHTERCGAGLWCDQSGSLVCEYAADLTMSCDAGRGEVDISYLFNSIPDNFYLLLEICDIDSPYCEYDYYPVTME